MTFEEILQSEQVDVWLDTGSVWLEWHNEEQQWVVFTDKNGPTKRIITTGDKLAAADAFVTASGEGAEGREK